MIKKVAALLAGLLLGLSAPAVADHIQEPTNPITGLKVLTYHYPQRSNPLACDGSDVLTFDQLRVDVGVAALKHDGTYLNGEEPSEHWNTFVSVHRMVTDGRGVPNWLLHWGSNWTHANIGPHVLGAANEFRMSLWHLSEAELWKFKIVVIGDASGNRFEYECQFRMDPSLVND